MMEAFALIMMIVAAIAVAVTGAADKANPHVAKTTVEFRDYSFTKDLVCREEI